MNFIKDKLLPVILMFNSVLCVLVFNYPTNKFVLLTGFISYTILLCVCSFILGFDLSNYKIDNNTNDTE